MLQPLQGNPRRTRVAKTKEFPPPTRGWVSRDNVFPLPDAVQARAGYVEAYDTTETASVETLMGYAGTTGVNKVFSVAGGNIYDGAAATTETSLTQGLSNSRFQHTMFGTGGGNFLYAVNGEDLALYYSGTAWVEPVITDVGTGFTSDNFAQVFVHKSRLFFCVKNTMKFSYLSVLSVAGAAVTFDLAQLFSKGGYLMAGGTLTRDGGSGPDDFAVFISSEGQAAIYQGSNPSVAADWALVGVYNLPRPIGRRCLYRAAGDLYLISEAGVVPITKAIALAESQVGTVAVTQNISNAMNFAARRYKANFGWEMMEYAEGPMAVLNVPLSAKETEQYVMNTQTGAWCRFKGLNAICWASIGGALYFGGAAGKVYLYGTTGNDNGSSIICDMKLAFDGFSSESQKKAWSMLRAVIISDGTTSPAVGLDVDFSDKVPISTLALAAANVANWDDFDWDDGSFWSETGYLFQSWVDLHENPGYAAAIRLRAEVNGAGLPVLFQVNGFNLMYTQGGVL